MDKDRFKEAREEAKRFLNKIKEFESASNPYDFSSQFAAAVKRSSMDLTRSLAKLRRS